MIAQRLGGPRANGLRTRQRGALPCRSFGAWEELGAAACYGHGAPPELFSDPAPWSTESNEEPESMSNTAPEAIVNILAALLLKERIFEFNL